MDIFNVFSNKEFRCVLDVVEYITQARIKTLACESFFFKML